VNPLTLLVLPVRACDARHSSLMESLELTSEGCGSSSSKVGRLCEEIRTWSTLFPRNRLKKDAVEEQFSFKWMNAGPSAKNRSRKMSKRSLPNLVLGIRAE
jgi:hypothetical protein